MKTSKSITSMLNHANKARNGAFVLSAEDARGTVIKGVATQSRAEDQLPTVFMSTKDELALALKTASLELNPAVQGKDAPKPYLDDTAISIGSEAMLYAGNPREYASQQFVAEAGMHFSSPMMPQRAAATQNYDQTVSLDTQKHTFIFNAIATNSVGLNAAINTMAPLCNVGSAGGIEVVAPVPYIVGQGIKQDGVPTSDLKSALTDILDSGISNQQTAILPIITASNAPLQVSVSETKIVSKDVYLDGNSDNTDESNLVSIRPYLSGVEIDYIGMSQSTSALKTDMKDRTDTLSPSVRITEVFFSLGDDVLSVNVGSMSSTNYYPKGRGEMNEMVGSLKDTFTITADTLQVNEAALADLNVIKTKNLVATYQIVGSGDVSLRRGVGEFALKRVELVSLYDVATETYLDIVTSDDAITLNALEFVDKGYYVGMVHWNSNTRAKGTIIDEYEYKESYYLGVRPPLSRVQAPNTTITEKDIATLSLGNNYDRAYELVNTLRQTAAQLSDIVSSASGANVPEVFGLGRKFLKTTYFNRQVDLGENLNSISHNERKRDMQGLLLGHIREMAFEVWVEAGYTKAMSIVYPGQDVKATCCVLLPEHLALELNGYDVEQLAPNFNWDFVSLPVDILDSEIYITFNFPQETTEKEFSVLNSMVGGWGPEIVYNILPSTGDSTSRMLLVSPRWEFYIHSPVMGKIDISNILGGIGKVD